MDFEPVIGLEVHAELATQSKMFCACPVVDTTQAEPNSAVCQVCSGMPGTLPVLNQKAVEYGLRVALALDCQIAPLSIFARKNYFYPDLPKGYQISQYEQPLARNGRMTIVTSRGEKIIRIRRVHLEEDTGKLTHVSRDGQAYTLVDLNRAGVPLLEIVTEPDFRSGEEVRAYAEALRTTLRYLGVNSGDMQKGVLRIEPNISLRPAVAAGLKPALLGTRVEVKNLNSFRALERAVAYQIQHQAELLKAGKAVKQVTLGWDEAKEETVVQRVKEGEDDYRYFPEPDLPPLAVEAGWIAKVRQSLPELPYARFQRLREQYGISHYTAKVLVEEKAVADYFEQAAAAEPSVPAKSIANWISGELFGLMNQAGVDAADLKVPPEALAELVKMSVEGQINQTTGREVLGRMFASGKGAAEIVKERGLQQVSDTDFISRMVTEVLDENPQEVAAYLGGKTGVANFLFGQVMKKAGGRANPQLVRQELELQLAEIKTA
ncbi:MAG: Asp-tRNA(Asn)/Glu-tRNA(Gln) amidotransferase subunit GatB [Anaerolineales bacterium]|nr:Asp-tRNA(Asn)/Glu-tRNA(Gln) amidotransferase subunit GatB [Anaerolineales bacterium]